MNNQTKLPQENLKRKAFKRFSQMGIAGLAALSISAFSHESTQEMPEKIENKNINKHTSHFERMLNGISPNIDEKVVEVESFDEFLEDAYGDYSGPYTNYQNSYSNYSENYSNSYSNYCNVN